MTEKKSVPLSKVIPMYKGKYSPEVITAIHNDLTNRIHSLQETVSANGDHPLVGEGCDDRVEISVEMGQRNQTDTSARRMLKNCEDSLERLITGKFGPCTGCDELIKADRLLAIPYASRCTPCEKKNKNPHVY